MNNKPCSSPFDTFSKISILFSIWLKESFKLPVSFSKLLDLFFKDWNSFCNFKFPETTNQTFEKFFEISTSKFSEKVFDSIPATCSIS